MTAMRQELFKDRDALAFEDNDGTGDARNAFYVGKRKRSSKGLEIIFDQEQHRDYVTGFHKRKVERRNKAQKEKAEKDKRQRLEERAEKRAKMREELDLERYETDSGSEREDKKKDGKGVRVYKSGDAVTTVTVAPLILNSDEEAALNQDGDSHDSSGYTGEAAVPPHIHSNSQQPASQRRRKQEQEQELRQQNKKRKTRKKAQR